MDAWDDLYPLIVITLWGVISIAGLIGFSILIFDRIRSR